MPKTWQVWIRNQEGARTANFTFEQQGGMGFDYTRRVNSPGAYGLRFVKKATESLAAFRARVIDHFVLDAQAEFSWRWPEQDIDWHTDGTFFHRTGLRRYNAKGALVYESGGRGYVDLLNRAIIDEFAGSAGAIKEGPAETVLKEFVNEQLGPGAGARAMPGLTIQADAGGGNNVRFSSPHRNVLQIAQEIAKIGGGDFDVVRTGVAAWEFRWYEGQRGADRSATVLFNIARGNMATPQLTEARHNETTRIIVGGQGEGSDREIVRVEDAVRVAASPWNAIERWRDARQEPDAAGLADMGGEWLEEGKPTDALTFKPLQVPGTLLDKHYWFGDLVRAEMLEVAVTKKVKAYSYAWSGQRQDLGIELEDA